MTETTDLVLRITGLKTSFYTYEGVVKALDGVEMYLRRGDTMGVVGETGCGKSVTAKSVLRLVEPPGRIEEGNVFFYDYDPKTGETEEIDILTLTNEQVLAVRGSKIAIVFQDPATYPNPVFRIGQQIAEVVLLHQDLGLEALEVKIADLRSKIGPDVPANRLAALEEKIAVYESQFDNPPEPDDKDKKRAAWNRAVAMLRLVRMPAPDQVAQQYPHELSGGMRQRALIAMALACNPSILICDEATTALDVTVQAQVLKLLNDLKSEIGTSIMIITHDLGVVAETCNWVSVMYAGATVESTSTEELFNNPIHPYTGGLLNSIPKLHEEKDRLDQILGTVPNLITPPTGCRFHPRCEFASGICKETKPLLEEMKQGHWVACHHPQGDLAGGI